MEPLLGLLRVKVVRGTGLVAMDSKDSDPYVVVTMGDQRLKTSVRRNSLNPEWNEDLTLAVVDPNVPLKIEVFDKDTITKDDEMGEAELSVLPLFNAAKWSEFGVPDGAHISEMLPNPGNNDLASESFVVRRKGRAVQDVVLRLRNAASGEVELQLEWVGLPNAEE